MFSLVHVFISFKLENSDENLKLYSSKYHTGGQWLPDGGWDEVRECNNRDSEYPTASSIEHSPVVRLCGAHTTKFDIQLKHLVSACLKLSKLPLKLHILASSSKLLRRVSTLVRISNNLRAFFRNGAKVWQPSRKYSAEVWVDSKVTGVPALYFPAALFQWKDSDFSITGIMAPRKSKSK